MPIAPSIEIKFARDTVVDGRGSSSDQSAITDWLLPPSHSESHFSSVIIFPRPNSETGRYERHRVNYPGQPYRIPIVVHGGRPPFRFTLLNAPAGMTIGRTLISDGIRLVRSQNYGVVSSPSLAAGTFNPIVRVEDQAGVVRTISWQIICDAADWNVLDTEAATNGSGTIDSPFKNLASIDNGKPVLVISDVDWSDKVDSIDAMSPTWVAAEGGMPVMYQASDQVGAAPGAAGLWFSGFKFTLNPENNGVNQFFRFDGLSRCGFFENVIDFNKEPYTVSPESENAAFMMWTNQGLGPDSLGIGRYNFLVNNAFKNVSDRDLLLAYSMRYCVVENNSMEGCTIGENLYGHGFYFKMSCSDITFRGNYSIGDENTAQMLRVDAYAGNFQMDRYDICYNSMRYFGELESGFNYCHEFVNAGSQRYFYRNTSYSFNTAAFYLRGMGEGDTVNFNANIFVSGGTNTNGIRLDEFQGIVNNTNYLAVAKGSSVLDANNHLQYPFNTNLGISGSEIK